MNSRGDFVLRWKGCLRGFVFYKLDLTGPVSTYQDRRRRGHRFTPHRSPLPLMLPTCLCEPSRCRNNSPKNSPITLLLDTRFSSCMTRCTSYLPFYQYPYSLGTISPHTQLHKQVDGHDTSGNGRMPLYPRSRHRPRICGREEPQWLSNQPQAPSRQFAGDCSRATCISGRRHV